MSLALPQQADEGIYDDAMLVADAPADSTTSTTSGEETPETPETAPTEALIALNRALGVLAVAAGPPERERQVGVPASRLAQLVLMLIDYRRSLEGDAARMMLLPTLRERDVALTAYQAVCQRVTTVLSAIDCLLKGLQ